MENPSTAPPAAPPAASPADVRELLKPYRNLKPNLDVFEDPRFAQYRIVRERLGEEPIDVIAGMRLSGTRRFRNGQALTAEDGRPLLRFPAFREIAPTIAHLSGEAVSHEAVRRWWLLAWGPEGHPLERDLGRRRYFGRTITPTADRHADAPPAAVFLAAPEAPPGVAADA